LKASLYPPNPSMTGWVWRHCQAKGLGSPCFFQMFCACVGLDPLPILQADSIFSPCQSFPLRLIPPIPSYLIVTNLSPAKACRRKVLSHIPAEISLLVFQVIPQMLLPPFESRRRQSVVFATLLRPLLRFFRTLTSPFPSPMECPFFLCLPTSAIRGFRFFILFVCLIKSHRCPLDEFGTIRTPHVFL